VDSSTTPRTVAVFNCPRLGEARQRNSEMSNLVLWMGRAIIFLQFNVVVR
jgi:hypothetical protein